MALIEVIWLTALDTCWGSIMVVATVVIIPGLLAHCKFGWINGREYALGCSVDVRYGLRVTLKGLALELS